MRPADDDRAWMDRALALAATAAGRTSPNPVVGAVVVEDGVVIAEGLHRGAGQAHAERDALAQLSGRDLSRATMVVNLEPCCHHGRTPPCTEALIAAGIGRVVVGMVDPDPRVSGRGIAALEAAGIPVTVGVGAAAARHLNAPFVVARTLGRPFVALKAAMTLDGHVADAAGQSKWITGPDARNTGHHLRNTHDAILVGAGTLLADDPSLNCRIPGGRDPLPVVLDGRLRCPSTARVLAAGRRPLLFCGEDVNLRPLPATVLPVPRPGGLLDLNAVMAALLARDLQSVLVEGGPRVHHSLIQAGMVDRIHLFINARVLAGGRAWVEGPPFSLPTAPGYRFHSAAPVGDDLHVVLVPTTGPLAPASE